MSVIITNMDMPKYCGSCNMSGTGVCRKWMSLNRYELGSKRSTNCPLKSVEGLIKKIKDVDEEYQSKHGVFLSATGCIQIIKEYCEVNDETQTQES